MITKKIEPYINWIVIGILACVNIILSCLNFDGNIGFKDFKDYTILAWVLFFLQLLIMPIIAVIITQGFINEGFRTAREDKEFQRVENEYYSNSQNPDKKLRSEKEYRMETGRKTFTFKFFPMFLFSLLATQMLITGELSAFISQLIMTCTMIATGLIQMVHTKEYCLTELKLWYIKECENDKHKR